jgi:hypothetical protein
MTQIQPYYQRRHSVEYDYDDDDFALADPTESIGNFDLSSDELDQYDDHKVIFLEQLEYRVQLAEEQVVNAYYTGADPDHIERLEDELEILSIDYFKFQP